MVKSLEKEFKEFIIRRPAWVVADNCSSNLINTVDFTLNFSGNSSVLPNANFFLDLKEKRQDYRKDLWPCIIPEPHMFILDEKAVMKSFNLGGLRGGVLIRVLKTMKYYLVTNKMLLTINKVRGNRDVGGKPMGKWIIDLRECIECNDLQCIINCAVVYMKNERVINACEPIRNVKLAIMGKPRTQGQMSGDYSVTR